MAVAVEVAMTVEVAAVEVAVAVFGDQLGLISFCVSISLKLF